LKEGKRGGLEKGGKKSFFGGGGKRGKRVRPTTLGKRNIRLSRERGGLVRGKSGPYPPQRRWTLISFVVKEKKEEIEERKELSFYLPEKKEKKKKGNGHLTYTWGKVNTDGGGGEETSSKGGKDLI